MMPAGDRERSRDQAAHFSLQWSRRQTARLESGTRWIEYTGVPQMGKTGEVGENTIHPEDLDRLCGEWTPAS
jgi:hypothetical protein